MSLATKKAGAWLTLHRLPVILGTNFISNFLFYLLYNPIQVRIVRRGSHGAHDPSRAGVPQSIVDGIGVFPGREVP
jgi:hypothetical protein